MWRLPLIVPRFANLDMSNNEWRPNAHRNRANKRAPGANRGTDCPLKIGANKHKWFSEETKISKSHATAHSNPLTGKDCRYNGYFSSLRSTMAKQITVFFFSFDFMRSTNWRCVRDGSAAVIVRHCFVSRINRTVANRTLFANLCASSSRTHLQQAFNSKLRFLLISSGKLKVFRVCCWICWLNCCHFLLILTMKEFYLFFDVSFCGFCLRILLFFFNRFVVCDDRREQNFCWIENN